MTEICLELDRNERLFVERHRSASWNAGFGTLYISSDPSVAGWNFIGALHDLPPAQISQRARAIFDSWERTPCLKVTPHCGPKGLEATLASAGWTPSVRLTSMIIAAPHARRVESDVVVRVCREEEEIRVFSEVQAAGFGDPDWVQWVYDINRVNAADPEQIFYLGELGSQPAGVCLLLSSGRTGGLYAVATLPEARGKGVARALVRRAVADSGTRGNEITCLSTDAGGPAKEAFTRLGFTPVHDSIYYVSR